MAIDGTQASLAYGSKVTSTPAYGMLECTESGGVDTCKPAPMSKLHGWSREARVTLTSTGTAKRIDTGFELSFAPADPKAPRFEVSCIEQSFHVAPVNAVVVLAGCPTPRWSVSTERADVFACTMMGDVMPFATPGIEEVDLKGDLSPLRGTCKDDSPDNQSGPMYRHVPPDNSVERALAPPS